MPTLVVKTQVLAGGRIEIPATGLPEGSEATVRIVVEEEEAPPPKRSIDEILAEYRGERGFKSVEEVDRHIREERDSWDD